MKERLITALSAVTLAVCVALVVAQGSFSFGEFAPTSIEQTYLFWAVSTLIFLLMVTLGFMLFRTAVRLYIERQVHPGRTGLKSKMVIGALALTFMPVLFMLLFSIWVLNRNLDKWFSRPAENIQLNLWQWNAALAGESRAKAEAQAAWLAALPETRNALATGSVDEAFFTDFCASNGLGRVELHRSDGSVTALCPERPAPNIVEKFIVRTPIRNSEASLVVSAEMPADLAARDREIAASVAEYEELRKSVKATRATYLLLLALISLFILFVATWLALFLAKQINVPIQALLEAASEVRRGKLGHRIDVVAIDELAILVRAFNEMTQSLESNSRELENRRRFIEAILDNVPTGVVSLSAERRVQTVNRALLTIFGEDRVRRAERLEDLFPQEEASELRYLFNRTRRTGVVTGQFEFHLGEHHLQLAVTISALEGGPDPGYVVVIEDTSELLRAQKAVAWREVARRIAHEIKNPLTPISLSAERIARQVEKASARGDAVAPEVLRILEECSQTISQEVDSLRGLVDEFSRFARFPAARPQPADLNAVVETALAVFADRLEGITLLTDLAPGLPPVKVDREQFKRVIVNLVDNSAEAMSHALDKKLFVGTRTAGDDAVELVVADTGCGVSMEDREKLFTPDFSTKGRGTGLGLAIVSQILAAHGAQIRVEENRPAGTRFVIEIPALPGIRVEEATHVAQGGS